MHYVALLLCIAFVIYLFRLDRRGNDDWSPVLWIPLTWMFFAGSRFLSHWLQLGPSFASAGGADGSPIDRAVFFSLMAAALWVAHKRGVDWTAVFLKNKLIWLFFVFGLVSVLWSPYPDVSAKRVFKAIGNVLIVMVILTEARPYAAAGAVLRRLGYLTLPLSIAFIKWFPAWGRDYHNSGAAMFTGVGMQKNSLGQLCLLVGVYCAWTMIYKVNRPILLPGINLRVEWLLIAMIVWLMSMADSATALACLIAALSIFVLGRLSIASTPSRLVGIAVVLVTLATALESTFSISATVIETLGRRSDLTTRVPMWEDLLARRPGNDWLGAGYEAYYLTQAGLESIEIWKVSTAHNGYLETFLSSGYIGLGLIISALVMAIWSVRCHDLEDFSGAVLRLSLLAIVSLYSWTESTFHGVSNTWVLFSLASVDIGLRRAAFANASKVVTHLRSAVVERPYLPRTARIRQPLKRPETAVAVSGRSTGRYGINTR